MHFNGFALPSRHFVKIFLPFPFAFPSERIFFIAEFRVFPGHLGRKSRNNTGQNVLSDWENILTLTQVLLKIFVIYNENILLVENIFFLDIIYGFTHHNITGQECPV